MRLSIRHTTTYAYDPPVERVALRLKLYPSQFEGQQANDWSISVNGARVPALLTGAFGDRESIWCATSPQEQVEVIAEGVVDTVDASGFVKGLREAARPGVFLRETPLTRPDDAIRALAGGAKGDSALNRMHALCGAVRDAMDYRPGATDPATPASVALKARAGVCQDHAHVFVSAARAMGTPARYVVGYLLALDTNLTETHAWAEAYVDGFGWIGFDPANRLCPTDRYVRLCSGLDAADAAPIRGAVSGQGAENLKASVDIAEYRLQTQQ